MAAKETLSSINAEPTGDGSAAAAEDGVFLSWTGRRTFRAAVPTPRVFIPVPEASDPTEEDPGNLVIEGDNRQAMVSLFAQYQSQVDVVVIDVPYNTGKNDFRYDDARFQDPDADGAMLRNVALFDQFNPDQIRGDDAPMGNTFCSLVPRFGGALAFADASSDPRVSHVGTPVVSYCGVQLRDGDGESFGTLCHFDLKPCEPRTSDLQFLEMLAPLLQRMILESRPKPI